MNLLRRVRYIVEVMLPQDVQSVHVQLLEVLTRVARHSLSAATQVRSSSLRDCGENVLLSLQARDCGENVLSPLSS